jgi:thioredoxin-like negative regulator of GroEL
MVRNKQIESRIRNGDKVVVYIWDYLYGPCMILKTIFDRVSKTNKGDVNMYSINVDDSKNLINNYNVRSIPKVLIFNKGKLVNSKVGMVGENKLKNLLNF